MNKRTQSQKKYKITNLQTQEIPHSTCVVFVSICCILRYLQYFGVLYIGIWIAKKVRFQIFFLHHLQDQKLHIWTSHTGLRWFIDFLAFHFLVIQWPLSGYLGTKGLNGKERLAIRFLTMKLSYYFIGKIAADCKNTIRVCAKNFKIKLKNLKF
jgi:hypothetical protein